jgi:GrpB-like predicted nucleotidyltransferase (UPF0157 family)
VRSSASRRVDLNEPDAALVLSDTILDEARATCLWVRRRMAELDIDGEVVLTGGSSVPGALTRGDIDLHLRVPPESFDSAVDRLGTEYRAASLSAWAPSLAVFDVPASRPAGLAVTPAGSEHDLRFSRAWERLRTDPGLLEEYNDLKRTAIGDPSYEDRKSAFFTRLAGP